MNTRAVNFPLMDSIRGIALLSMLAAHTSLFIAKNGDHALQRVRFDFAVRVFFVISAFLLYHPFVRARLRGDPFPSVKAFAWRRALRILPAYWSALTIIAIWRDLPGVFTATGIPTYYGFAQIYGPTTVIGGLPQAWSLCVEVIFYLLLPFYAWTMRRARAADGRAQLRNELVGAAMLAAVSLAFKLTIAAAGTLDQPSLVFLQSNPAAFLDDFALGIALASIHAYWEGRPLPRPLALLDRWPVIAWAVALVTVWVVSTQVGLTGQLGEPVHPRQYLERHYLFTIVALGLVLPAMFGDPRRGLVRRLLAWRPLLYVGMISYAIYLYHFAVLRQLEDWRFATLAGHTWTGIWYPAVLAGGVLLASVSYYALERPLLRLKRLVPDPALQAARGEAIVEPAPVAPPALRTSASTRG